MSLIEDASNKQEGNEISVNSVQVKRSEIPHYLRKSDFYRALCEEDDELCEVDDELICIPVQNYRDENSISSIQDLHDVLSTYRFWGVDEVPRHLIEFILNEEADDALKTVITRFEQEMTFLSVLMRIKTCLPSDKIFFTIKADCAVLLHYYESSSDNHRSLMYDPTHCAHAAFYGSFECLKYLHKTVFDWDANTCKEAAKGNHLAWLVWCMQYSTTASSMRPQLRSCPQR